MSETNDPNRESYMEEEEQELLSSVERGEWQPATDADSLRREAVSTAEATLRKDRRMNVRISERDMRKLKARAAEEGIPYQTLVTMVLHKYVTGRLEERR